MKNYLNRYVNKYWRQLSVTIESRSRQERLLLLLAAAVILVYATFVLLLEPMQISAEQAQNRVRLVNSQTTEEVNRQSEINATYSADPGSFARDRQAELRQSLAEADRRLGNLYGQLIDPQQMSLTLAQLLQNETALEIISLNNLPPELLGTSTATGGTQSSQGAIEVYRHGLQMVFEGGYLDTIKFLRDLESMETNFFWDNMEYTVAEYPNARITLNIYTLSTKRGWLGV